MIRLTLLTLFISSMSWAAPHIGIIAQNTSYGMSEKSLLRCWNDSGHLDVAFCQVTRKEHSCDMEVEFPLSRSPGTTEEKRNANLKARNYDHFYLDYKKGFLGFRSFSKEDDNYFTTGFNKLKKVSFTQTDEDISSLFSLKAGQILIKDARSLYEKFTRFQQKLIFKIEGTCTSYKSLGAIKEIKMFERPVADAKVIGRLVLYKNSSQQFLKYHGEGSSKDFIPNLSSSWGLVFQTHEVKDNYLNIGKGPWGEKGWVKVPYVSMFSGFPILFLVNGDTVEFLKDESGQYFKRVIPQEVENKTNLFNGHLLKANRSEIFNKDNLLHREIVDISLENRKDSTSTEMIDFTNSEFILNGGTKRRAVQVYGPVIESSPLLGTINFLFENNNLSAEFIDTKSKKTKIKTDYFFGKCGSDLRFVALNKVYETKLFYSQIGPGPWGKEGWVKERRLKAVDLEKTCDVESKVSDRFELRYINLLSNNPAEKVLSKESGRACEAVYYNSKAFKTGDFTIVSSDRISSSFILELNSEVFRSYSSGGTKKVKLSHIFYPSKLNAFVVKQFSHLPSVIPGKDHPKKYRPEISQFKINFTENNETIYLDKPSEFIDVPVRFLDFKEERELTLLLGDSKIQTVATNIDSMVLKLTKGVYPLRFIYQVKDKVFQFQKNIEIKNSSIPLKISQNDFTEKPLQHIEPSFDEGHEFFSYNFNDTTHFNLDEAYYFDGEKKIDFNKRAVFYDPIIRSNVQALLDKTPYSFFKVGGLCQKATFSDPSIYFDVFNSASHDAKIGILEVNRKSGVKFTDNHQVTTKIKTLMNSNCEGVDHLLLGVRKQSGKRALLGLGPWGELAWIEGQSHSSFGKLSYNLPGEGSVTLVGIKENEMEFIPEFSREVKKVPLYKVFTSDGKFKNSFTCW